MCNVQILINAFAGTNRPDYFIQISDAILTHSALVLGNAAR